MNKVIIVTKGGGKWGLVRCWWWLRVALLLVGLRLKRRVVVPLRAPADPGGEGVRAPRRVSGRKSVWAEKNFCKKTPPLRGCGEPSMEQDDVL